MVVGFFFCKQKKAYDMRISDWSSDVCSSDLPVPRLRQRLQDFMRIVDRRRHEHRSLTAGVAEHQPLVARALILVSRRVDTHGDVGRLVVRSEERRAGKEWVSKFLSRWAPYY